MRPLDGSYDLGKSRRHRHTARPITDVDYAPVLYIHPAKQGPDFLPETDTGRPYGLIPLGLPAVVNVLRANGIRVEGVVHPLEKQLDPSFELKTWLRERSGAKVILIDLHWYEHCYGAI